LFLFSFSLLEFISGVCGLRWLCRVGIVAYYVEYTNVVKKWNGSLTFYFEGNVGPDPYNWIFLFGSFTSGDDFFPRKTCSQVVRNKTV